MASTTITQDVRDVPRDLDTLVPAPPTAVRSHPAVALVREVMVLARSSQRARSRRRSLGLPDDPRVWR